jgi:hypothetical protein
MKTRLLHEKDLTCVTEEIFKETLTQNISPSESSYSKEVRILKILCPLATARSSLVSVCRQPDASYSHLKTLTQFQNPHGPFYWLRLMFLTFIKKVWIPDFHKC